MMQHRPDVAFRCGPYALTTIAPLLEPAAAERTAEFLRNVQSPPIGFSLSEVLAMSRRLDLRLQMAKRSPGSEVVLPAVAHWKIGHFGALVRALNGKHLLQKPTFVNDVWLSERALDQEASGYFLVPEGRLPMGWRSITPEEAGNIYGKGHSGNTHPEETAPEDHQTP